MEGRGSLAQRKHIKGEREKDIYIYIERERERESERRERRESSRTLLC